MCFFKRSLDDRISYLEPRTSFLYMILRFRRLLVYPELEELLLKGIHVEGLDGLCLSIETPGEVVTNYTVLFDNIFYISFKGTMAKLERDLDRLRLMGKAVTIKASLLQRQLGTPDLVKLHEKTLFEKTRNYRKAQAFLMRSENIRV